MAWSEKTILFDLDGTLVDTAPDLHASLKHAFAVEGLVAADLPTIRPVVGHGARAMIAKSATASGIELSAEQSDRMFRNFIEYYTENIADFSQLFPGIRDTLEYCHDRRAKLAVCTNKTQALAEQLLGELNLMSCFDVVVGADRTSEKKPSPTHIRETVSLVAGHIEQSVMIGDSSTDAHAAKAAGIPFIFMTYGYPDQTVEEINPTTSLGSAEDLPAAIRMCFS